jgi:hypothetical protein
MIGILLALQVNNWNESRKRDAAEKAFLLRLKTDLEEDQTTFREILDYFQVVYDQGLRALGYIEKGQDFKDDCVQALVWFYNASQWRQLRPVKTTFEEITLTGFPRNQQIKDFVVGYQRSLEELPQLNPPSEYRQHIRSIIPPKTQILLDETCHVFERDFQIVDINCQPAISPDQAHAIVSELVSHPDTRHYLTFWLSTIKTLESLITPNLEEALKIIQAIDLELD